MFPVRNARYAILALALLGSPSSASSVLTQSEMVSVSIANHVAVTTVELTLSHVDLASLDAAPLPPALAAALAGAAA